MYMIYLGHFHLLLPFLIPLSLLLYPFFLTSPHPIFMGFFFGGPVLLIMFAYISMDGDYLLDHGHLTSD